LIAEEVDKVMPELVVRDEENRPESVQYLELIPLLLQERQKLQAELARQRGLIEQQAETLAALQRTLDARFAALEATEATQSASRE
jgi:short-subunit dehydrogenase involved in D-alanine esterification of teichoic acids